MVQRCRLIRTCRISFTVCFVPNILQTCHASWMSAYTPCEGQIGITYENRSRIISHWALICIVPGIFLRKRGHRLYHLMLLIVWYCTLTLSLYNRYRYIHIGDLSIRINALYSKEPIDMYIRFEIVAHRSTTMMAIFILHFWLLLLDTQAASGVFDLWWFYLFLGGWVMKCKVWVGRNYREFLCESSRPCDRVFATLRPSLHDRVFTTESSRPCDRVFTTKSLLPSLHN